MTAPAWAGGVLVVLAATLWGTAGTVQALAPTGATPLAVAALRLWVGGGTLVLLALGRGGLRGSPAWNRPLTALAVLSAALYQVAFFAGVNLTGVAVGTVVGIGSAVAFAGLLGRVFAGEHLTRRWYISTSMAGAGMLLLVWAGNDGAYVNPLGVALALGAGFSYALFTLVNKFLLADHPADEVMAVALGGGALLLTPVLFLVDLRWVVSGTGLVLVVHLGVLATGIAYALFGRGLRAVGVSAASTLTLAEPFTAALLGLVVLGEPVTVGVALGLVLIFGGLALLTVRIRPR